MPSFRDAGVRKPFCKAVVLLSFVFSCGEAAHEPIGQRPVREEARQVEIEDDCLDRYFDSDISPPLSFGKGLGRDRRVREMRMEVEDLYSKMRRGSESAEYYAEFFSKARHSNGDLMFPGAADVISGNVFPNASSKRLAGRRMAKSMRTTRFPNAYALLNSMPKTAVVLVDRVNRPRSGMDVEHAEDIAGFFRALLGFQNRMGSEQELCDFQPNMSREQLNEFDSYYSNKILNWNNPVTGKRVCTNCKKSIETGDFERFGLTRFPDGMEAAFCRQIETD